MTGNDLRRLQDAQLELSKKLLLENGQLPPIGVIVTLHKHLDKLLDSGWGVELVDPPKRARHADDSATLVVDLSPDPERLYQIVLRAFPKTRDILPPLIELGKARGVDNVYMRTIRGFMKAAEINEKDIITAALRQICDQASAFACILYSVAWTRHIDPSDAQAAKEACERGLANDPSANEALISLMETHDFTQMLVVPIKRQQSSKTSRGAGKVIGFGEVIHGGKPEGRLTGFLRPLGTAS